MHISVIIPTRLRADTLHFTLKTCISQDFDGAEFIVSMNACTNETKEVVSGLKDSRIRMVETPERLSMSDNWEFGLQHAKGTYVTFIGDDDGLVPRGLSSAWEQLVNHDLPDAAIGPGALFVWPEAIKTLGLAGCHPGMLNGNTLPAAKWFDSAEMLRRYAQSDLHYSQLPAVYYGLVKATLIDKARCHGRFFNSKIPDVYSAVAIAAVSERYLMLPKSFAITGLSKHSTGAIQIYGGAEAGLTSNSASLFFTENNLPFHADLTECTSLAVLMGESFLQARDLGLIDSSVEWNYARMLDAAIAELPRKSPDTQGPLILALREIAKRHRIDDSKIPLEPVGQSASLEPGVVDSNPPHYTFHLNASLYGIKNIEEASIACGLLQDFGIRVDQSFQERSQSTTKLEAHIAELYTQRDSLYQERDSLYQERDSLYQERDSLYQERGSLCQERDSLCQERDTLFRERESLRQNLSDLHSIHSGLSKDLSAHKVEVKELRTELKSLQKFKKRLFDDLLLTDDAPKVLRLGIKIARFLRKFTT